jgi:hypothetical protein
MDWQTNPWMSAGHSFPRFCSFDLRMMPSVGFCDKVFTLDVSALNVAAIVVLSWVACLQGIPVPFALVFGNNCCSRVLTRAWGVLVAVLPGLFAFQAVIIARARHKVPKITRFG